HEDRIVMGRERLNSQQPNAGPLKDLLRNDRAAENPAEAEPEPGDDRQQTIAQRVSDDHQSLGQPLGARRPDEIATKYFEQTPTHQPHVDWELLDCQHYNRQEHGPQKLGERVAYTDG